jgi:hypothetical protein
LFFRCFLGLLCSPGSVGLDFGSLVVSVGFSRLGLWVPLDFGSSGCFFGVSGFVGVVGAFCCFWACHWVLGL